MPASTSVLFVCLGNICRSPLAEGVLLSLLEGEGLEGAVPVESAGTGAWHVGNKPDPRSRAVARENGVELRSRARQVEPLDFSRFRWIIAMDRENLRHLRNLQSDHGGDAQLRLLLDFHPDAPRVSGATDGMDVPDPYYGGPEGFQTVFELVMAGCRGLLDEIRPGGTRLRGG